MDIYINRYMEANNKTIKLRFKGKPYDVGTSIVVVIPKTLIANNYIKVGNEYSFEVLVNA